MTATTSKPSCKYLVLDAGPLLSLSPLRGLAEQFITVPQVLSELKDSKARQHFEQLGLSMGVSIDVREPDPGTLAEVIQFAKKTGDYSVLSHADLCVIALTLSIDRREKAVTKSEDAADPTTEGTTAVDAPASAAHEGAESTSSLPEPVEVVEEDAESSSEGEIDVNGEQEGGGVDHRRSDDEEAEHEPLDVSLVPLTPEPQDAPAEGETAAQSKTSISDTPLFEDPSDEDDGEGDWVTPSNIGLYKSQALELVPSADISDPFITVSKKSKNRRRNNGKQADLTPQIPEKIVAGCMTADFAMQNVILQMGLNLVGMEGKRIQKVKNWVLRCHACYKICKDNSKKFCPSCGNPTLLRTSVTISAPGVDGSAPTMQVHLKKNFVYRTRGTVYSIPSPKPGSSKTGSGEGLILREDQTEYMRAVKREDGRREREEKKMLQSAVAAAKAGKGTGVQIGSWMDPDWTPGLMSGSADMGRKAPNSRVPLGADGMPVIGYGKKNPNARRRRK
ncbi:hypothetical protein SCHPADRAFT_926597 [Schizopora paradoxa]|uniref:20S-pre-rRNA D-site endonuclease NOB1 n=1 Tax=Schizopora paradoxa TaxID=27342 RepID=A0A0H2RXL3_9AGAM|nr:hypothetical protein SCHPADRAFT_926597 [Schizopora paradoxa]